MRDLAFMVLFASAIPAALSHVHASVMLWIWTAIGTPNYYLYGFAHGVPFNKLAAVTTMVALFTDRIRSKPYFDLHLVLLTLFLAQGIISFSVGLSGIDRSYDILDKMVKITVLCIVMTMASRQRSQIHATVVVICLSGGIHGALEGLKYIASGGAHRLETASLGDNNYLALATLMVMPLLWYLYKYSVVPAARVLFLGFLGACLVGVIATASRGGLIGLVILGGFLWLNGRRKVLGLVMVGIIAAGLVSFTPDRWRDRMNTISTAEQDGSFMSRVASWKLHTIVALDRPLVGGGYSPLEDPRVSAAYRPKMEMLDFIPTPPLNGPLAAHSSYFQVLGDLGFPGLLLFLLILVVALRNTKHIRRDARGVSSLAWADDLARTYRMTLVVYMVSGAALSASYFEILYVMLTQISVLKRHLAERAAEAAVPQGRRVGASPLPRGPVAA